MNLSRLRSSYYANSECHQAIIRTKIVGTQFETLPFSRYSNKSELIERVFHAMSISFMNFARLEARYRRPSGWLFALL